MIYLSVPSFRDPISVDLLLPEITNIALARVLSLRVGEATTVRLSDGWTVVTRVEEPSIASGDTEPPGDEVTTIPISEDVDTVSYHRYLLELSGSESMPPASGVGEFAALLGAA